MAATEKFPAAYLHHGVRSIYRVLEIYMMIEPRSHHIILRNMHYDKATFSTQDS